TVRRLPHRPGEDPLAESTRFHEQLHEAYLVDASLEEETRELRQGLFREVTATVEVVPPRQVAVAEQLLVAMDLRGQAARGGPEHASVERLKEHSVRDEARQ